MTTHTLRAAARWLERTVIGLAIVALAFRVAVYPAIGKPPGAAYGAGDVTDYALGLLLFLLCGACAACGVALAARATDDAGKVAAYRPILVGMTTFVVYYLVHPYVAELAPAAR